MKKIAGFIFASMVLCFTGGVFAFPSGDQTDDPAPIVAAPPVLPNAAAASELVPLSSLSTDSPAKATKIKYSKRRGGKKIRHSRGGKLGSTTRIRTAQISLAELGYRPGDADGAMGPKTKAALKEFQRDHRLHTDGVLGPVTYEALIRETGSHNPMRNSSAPPENFFAAHPDYYGYYGADYANPTALGAPQMIPNRFGNLELDQQQTGASSQYALMLDGKQVFRADNQPSAINVSRTFTIGTADAIVLTSYGASDSVCPYRHYLLVLRPHSNGVHQIENCTRNYQAFTEQGTLFISFPGELHNGWSSGAMWRYEDGSLEKL